jgi:Fe-S-cluster containining protein
MNKFGINFECIKCGACCKNLGKISEIYCDLDRGDGICKYYNFEKKLCSVYENRPIKCNILGLYELFKEKLELKIYLYLTKRGCWALQYFEFQKKIHLVYLKVNGVAMFELNLSDEQKSVFLGLLNGLILADGVISPAETDKWNFFASLFHGITYKSVATENLKAVFVTNKAKSSVLLELMSVALSKENVHSREDAQSDDVAFITKIAHALEIGDDSLQDMWLWVEKMISLVNESNTFME